MEILLELRSKIFETIFAPRSGLLCSHSLYVSLSVSIVLSLPACLYLSLYVSLDVQGRYEVKMISISYQRSLLRRSLPKNEAEAPKR
jgi:hypothetical protein